MFTLTKTFFQIKFFEIESTLHKSNVLNSIILENHNDNKKCFSNLINKINEILFGGIT